MYTAKNDRAIAEVKNADRYILDIGCGTGKTAQEIKSSFPSVFISGVNFAKNELMAANCSLDEAIEADLNQFDPTLLRHKYDLIICSHILEHLIDPKLLLEKLANSLSDCGRIIVLVPNFGVWRARVKVLAGNFEYEDSGLFDRTHLRFFTHFNLNDELVPSNLVVSEQIRHAHFPLPGLRNRLPSSLVNFIDRSVTKLWPNLFCNEIGLILEKPTNA